MSINLLTPLRIILKVSIGYEKIFEDIKSRSFFVRLVFNIHRFLHPNIFSTLMVACYGAKSFLSLSLRDIKEYPIIITANVCNEKKHANFFADSVGRSKVGFVNISVRNIVSLSSLKYFILYCRNLGRVRKYFSVVSYINRKYGFMPACRSVSMIGFYLRFVEEIKKIDCKAVAVVSDYSPDGLALIYAARKNSRKIIYMTHSFIHHHFRVTAQNFDLIFFDGSVSYDNYRNTGKDGQNIGRVVFMGLEGKSMPIRTSGLRNVNMRIGIFLTAPVNMDKLIYGVDSLKRIWQPENIVIRPHPEPLARPDFSLIIKDNVVLSTENKLMDDIERCDIAVVGNTSAVLEILKSGLPCVYYHGFEGSSWDYCGFVASGLVPEIKDFQDISIDNIRDFYDRDDWHNIFLKYDPYYGKSVNKSDIIRKEVDGIMSL
ncbi:MAG: hypothetical protein R3D71_10445 [Rickettsiales bacterium]